MRVDVEDRQKRVVEVVRSTPNRGRAHIFLGNPSSDGCDKTTVEPGNTFSPGVWTCGVSIWVVDDDTITTPDLLPDTAIEWGFAPEMPILQARYPAGRLRVTNRLTHIGDEGSVGVDYCAVTIEAAEAVSDATVFIVVRDTGPAGAKIASIEPENDALIIGGAIRLIAEQPAARTVILPADNANDSPLALLRYDLPTLSAGETSELSFKVVHGWVNSAGRGRVPAERLTVAQGLSASKASWEYDLPTFIFCPDARVVRAWEQCSYHLLAAMECGLPRIGAVNYPIFWIRDGILLLRALDTIGRHDLARLGCDYLAPLIFSGGFGAEADAPGEGIWALVNHARRTYDGEWLAGVYPQIEARAHWIEAMLETTYPLREVSENRIPRYLNIPDINLVCYPAVNGLIHGRMDWHSPDFYINCWAVCGLRMAAQAGRKVGRQQFTERWEERANVLERAVAAHLLPQYGNDRDPIVTPHPTGTLFLQNYPLRSTFEQWYRKNRLTEDGTRRGEPLWTYFEVAQAHNAFLLDLPDLAWITLNGLLDDGLWNISAWGEGEPDGNERLPFRNNFGARGWLDPMYATHGNMPHNWTGAEMLLLLRDLFVIESEGALLLGHGIPDSWRMPGATFGVQNMPTDHGVVSYTATVQEDRSISLAYEGPPGYLAAFHVHRSEATDQPAKMPGI